jgi:acyl-CoA thioester hydrolase
VSTKIFHTGCDVRFAETDASGIVYYNNYFVYFELGRVALFKELGLPYDRRVPIKEAYCDFKASACFGDSLSIYSHLAEPPEE